MNETSRMLTLAWVPPDNPNGIITKYELYRNDTLIYSGEIQTFRDENLTPFTYYIYYIIVFTSGGSSRSVDNLYKKTLSDIPEGVNPPVIEQVRDRSVVVHWFRPATPNGIITRYVLRSVSSSGDQKEHYNGLDLSKQVTGLNPFTLYTFHVTVCTVVGCKQSKNTTISTRSAAPDSQPAPYTRPAPGGYNILVEWDSPAKPNGKILFYDLYYRVSPFMGEGNTVASKLNPKNRNYTVTSLQPYTLYEFRVVCYTAQVKGSTASNWTRVRTLEGGMYFLVCLFACFICLICLFSLLVCFLCLFVCLFVYLFVYLFVCLICLFVCLFVCMFNLLICLFLYLFVSLFVCFFVCLICLFVYLFVCLII